MPGPWSTRLIEIFAQLESAYGVSPGALAGTDAFKSRTVFPFTRNVARYENTREQGNRASILKAVKGKESSSWTIPADLIPSGNAAAPTAPDADVMFEAHLGSKHTATAHTTLAAGSTATVLNFATGGVVASGTVVGDIIVVDVDATFGLQAREVTGIATDAVTVAPALSAAPAVGRNVYTGTTYRLSAAALKTIHLWQYLDGNNFRHKTGGNAVRTMGISCNFTSDAPIAEVTFSGAGKQIETHAIARPTPVTAGDPLLPSEAKVYIGASAILCVTNVELNSDNGLVLRMNESCSLFPTGVKRTDNDGNFDVTQTIEALLLSGVIEGVYDAAAALTSYDITVQLGVTPGKIVAWRTAKFIPEVAIGEADGEVSISMSGRAYGNAVPSTEVVLFFG